MLHYFSRSLKIYIIWVIGGVTTAGPDVRWQGCAKCNATLLRTGILITEQQLDCVTLVLDAATRAATASCGFGLATEESKRLRNA